MIGCRRASKNGNNETFILPDALEEQAAAEAIKLMQRAVYGKYPEVRMAAAVFAWLVAPMLIRIYLHLDGWKMLRKSLLKT